MENSPLTQQPRPEAFQQKIVQLYEELFKVCSRALPFLIIISPPPPISRPLPRPYTHPLLTDTRTIGLRTSPSLFRATPRLTLTRPRRSTKMPSTSKERASGGSSSSSTPTARPSAAA